MPKDIRFTVSVDEGMANRVDRYLERMRRRHAPMEFTRTHALRSLIARGLEVAESDELAQSADITAKWGRK